MSYDAAIDNTLLKEAADWAMTFRYDTPDASQHRAFERWRQQSKAHDAAWERAQSVFHTFEQVPEPIGKKAIARLETDYNRRHMLKLLSAALVAVPAGWLAWRQLPWQSWAADVRTATGERRSIDLPDGSQLVLNTNSAVNIAFSAQARRLRLVEGEILIITHTDPAPVARPFLVDTAYGVVRALGTRFSVRQLDQQHCRVAVFESAVEVRPLAGTVRTLNAGEQADFDMSGVTAPSPVENSAALWEQGMLLAKDMRLGDVIDELARHRPGILRCDPAVAGLRVSGAISLADTDAGLALLEKNLPVRIRRATPYWVSVVPQG